MNGTRILIVEDEFALAAELAGHFRSVGAEVLGPAPSLAKAAKYIDQADGAILDIDLNGELVFPLADLLAGRGVPFVFFSGNDEIILPERFRYSPRLPKPASWRTAINMLAQEHLRHVPRDATDIVEILPKLRLAARLHLGDPEAADRLVERTLKAAIRDTSGASDDLARAEWLNGLMEEILSTERAEILN